MRLADLHRWRARPLRTGLDLLGSRYGGAGLDVSASADAGTGEQGGTGADGGVLADLDASDMQHIALQPVAGKIHFLFDRTVLAQGQQASDGWQGVHLSTLADLRAQPTGISSDPCSTRDIARAGGIRHALRSPNTQVNRAAALIVALSDACRN